MLNAFLSWQVAAAVDAKSNFIFVMWCPVTAGALTIQTNTDEQFIPTRYDFSQENHGLLTFSLFNCLQFGGSLLG